MELNAYNIFINSSIILEDYVLVKKIYNDNRDSYSEQKIKLLRTNIALYWCGLDKKNKIKYLKLIDADVENINYYDDFVKYGCNVNEIEFKKKFYDNNFDFNNKKDMKKMMMLRNDLTKFWKALNEDEKIKFIELVKESDV